MIRDLGAYIQESKFTGERILERAACVLEVLMKSGWEWNNWREDLSIDGRVVEVVFTVSTRQESRN